MPDRIVRAGILTSDAVNRLSWQAEVFYRRLMNVLDDYGRYDGRSSVLRGQLFSLRLDKVSEPDIGKWIRETVEAGLVRMYTVEGKPYLVIQKFGQQIRAKKSKWPDPPTDENTCLQMQADSPVSVDVFVDVSGNDVGQRPDVHPPSGKGLKAQAVEVLTFLNEKAGRAYEPVDANIDLIVSRLKDGATVMQCRQVIAKKCREWLHDDKMKDYVRPATLFNKTKFAQYQGELVAQQESFT